MTEFNSDPNLQIGLGDLGREPIVAGNGNTPPVIPTTPPAEPTIVITPPVVVTDPNAVLVVGSIVAPETLTDQAVEIDGVQLTLDAQGNAYDADNKLVYTASDIQSFEGEFTINNAIAQSPYQIAIDGNVREYTHDAAGFLQREKDIAEFASATASRTAINDFFNANPDLLDVYRYKQANQTVEGYTPRVDYSKIQLDPNNHDLLRNVIREGESRKGTDPTTIADLIKFYEIDNKLAATAERYQADIIKQDASTIAAEQARANAQAIEAAERSAAFLGVKEENGKIVPVNAPNSLYDVVVNKGIIGGATLPADGISYSKGGVVEKITRENVFDAIVRPADASGNSKLDIELAKIMADPARLANLAMIVLRDTQLSQLVDARAKTTNVIKTLNTKSGSTRHADTPSKVTGQNVSFTKGLTVGLDIQQ